MCSECSGRSNRPRFGGKGNSKLCQEAICAAARRSCIASPCSGSKKNNLRLSLRHKCLHLVVDIHPVDLVLHVLGQTIKKIDHFCLLYTYRLKTLNLFSFLLFRLYGISIFFFKKS